MPTSRTADGVVVVGAGLGGIRTAEALRAEGFAGAITLIGEEPHLPYDRPPLSKQILSGRLPDDRASLSTTAELRELDIDLRLNTEVVYADQTAVQLAGGTEIRYDALVVATGVRPRRLPGQPVHPRLHVLRTLDECRDLRSSLAKAGTLLVIGGGFVGAEVAATARAGGVDVTIVEELPVPFARVLGEEVATRWAQLHRDNGVTLECGVRVAEFTTRDDGITVRLDDGRTLDADCALVSVGTSIDHAWLRGLGLATGSGLTCDEHGLVAGTSNVYAVGDIAAWRNGTHDDCRRIEHWTSATEQAAVVAQRIAGVEITKSADSMPYFWSDQHGIKLQLVGRPELANAVEILRDPGTIKGTIAGYFQDGTLTAAATFQAPKALAHFRGLVAQGADRTAAMAKAAELP